MPFVTITRTNLNQCDNILQWQGCTVIHILMHAEYKLVQSLSRTIWQYMKMLNVYTLSPIILICKVFILRI